MAFYFSGWTYSLHCIREKPDILYRTLCMGMKWGIKFFWLPYDHRVDREDITIIILDTKLVPDFVLHACCFFIAGNRPVLMLLWRIVIEINIIIHRCNSENEYSFALSNWASSILRARVVHDPHWRASSSLRFSYNSLLD